MIVKSISNKQVVPCILIVFTCISFMVQAQAPLPKMQQHHSTASVAPIKSEHEGELIILVHGLMRTSLSMRPLKSYLESQSYHAYFYSYPSVKYTIQQHGIYLNQFIRKFSHEHPGIKIHFITHSLGGIIVREALAQSTPKQLKSIGYLIMLAPPNQGSKLATLSVKVFPMIASFIKPLPELSVDKTSYVHHVSVPKIKVGIIAGKYDAKVPPQSARLAGQVELVVVNSTHTFIMNNAKTKELIIHFLKKGTFS